MILFQYSNKKTFLHEINALYKFCFLLITPFMVLLNRKLAIVLIILSLLMLANLHLDIKKLFKKTRWLLLSLFAILLIRTFPNFIFSSDEMIKALFMVNRFICSFLITIIFFASTSIFEMQQALMTIERYIMKNLFHKEIKICIISLIITLIFSFIPQFFYLYQQTKDAYQIRNIKTSYKQQIIMQANILLIVFDKLLIQSKDMIDAIIVRNL